MQLRHIVFGAVLVAFFGIGMLNVMSDGRFAHMLASQLPGHAGTGNASIQQVEEVRLEQGETVTRIIELRNVKRVSYVDPTISANGTDSVNFSIDLAPPFKGVEQSMPPNYVYDHKERTVTAILSFEAKEAAESAKWNFELTARPGEIRTEKISREIPVRIESDR